VLHLTSQHVQQLTPPVWLQVEENLRQPRHMQAAVSQANLAFANSLGRRLVQCSWLCYHQASN
jgi:hypothetical protein